ncbi:SH3 domain-containing protein [Treponema sp. C6A8]|uniref:SH3 domain-containing protein n=1 Tax=Treponema sp. C6A8 TaxID=1410609 RepID=UPI000488B480|nr:SH3 domain-containing protein [Treponema sp. C6A8]
MKNRIFTIFTLLFLCTTLYAQQLEFVAKKDFTWTSIIGKKYHISKDEILQLDDDGIGFVYPNSPKEIEIWVKNSENESLNVPINFLTFNENVKVIQDSIKSNYWVPAYYYEQISSKTDRYSILYKNEPLWREWQNQFENPSTWQEDFFLGYYGFNDFYFFARNSYIGNGEATFLVKTEDVSDSSIKYKVCKMYSHFQKYTKRTAHPQENFLPLYKKETPFYIYLIIDGDYMKMYIDEVSEKNLFQTLIRTSPEACNQIENWIKGKSNDLSKVVMPKHGNVSVQTEVTKTNATNVAPNKTMTVSENLKLRSGEATSTQVLTVMSAGTKVKILELGKAETIDGISSNWVKVEVQKGAKDREGKPIKAGTVGWCYGGYLE